MTPVEAVVHETRAIDGQEGVERAARYSDRAAAAYGRCRRQRGHRASPGTASRWPPGRPSGTAETAAASDGLDDLDEPSDRISVAGGLGPRSGCPMMGDRGYGAIVLRR